jgi:DNA-binding Lrp family transcriptional regulator
MPGRLNADKFFPVAEKISEDPFLTIHAMSSQIQMSRSTISRRLKKMYADRIIIGPQLSVRPHRNYIPYIYLLQVSNPLCISGELKALSSVKNHAVAMGEWNACILTDRMMDFSALDGFQRVVFSGKRYDVYSPRIRYTTWEQSWREIKQKLEHCTPTSESTNGILPELPWGEQEWQLYRALRLNARQDILPLLRKHHIRYETFQRWRKTLVNHCTVHTGFYPGGLDRYMDLCILFRTKYAQTVKELFSLFPATPFLADLDDHILVLVRITSDMMSDVGSLIYGMKEKGIVEDARCAVVSF